jgi:hypothetical protein
LGGLLYYWAVDGVVSRYDRSAGGGFGFGSMRWSEETRRKGEAVRPGQTLPPGKKSLFFSDSEQERTICVAVALP